MSGFFNELGGLTGGAGAEALAFAAGFAAARALEPAGVTIAQDAWSSAPIRRLDAGEAAEATAEGLMTEGQGADEASYSGYDSTRFAALYDLALSAPGMGDLLTMLRRRTINPGNFEHGLRKAKLEPMWDDAIRDLATQYIGLGDIAAAIVRGAVPAPSWVPVAPPATTTKVQRYPVVDVDPVALAAKLGFDENMLRIMVARSGLSLAPGLAAQAFFRGVIADDDFHLAVAEGDLRTEWADALKEVSRMILSPHEYQEAALRGLISNEQANAKSAQHGMTTADADLLFGILGRPLATHQITTGLARGGEYGGTYDDVPEPYRDAIRRSAIRPEYARLDYANRFTIPSYFILRAILQDGGMTEEEFADYGKQLGWPPALAEKAASALGTAKAAPVDKNVAKAEVQLWTASHKAFVAETNTRQEIADRLTLLEVPETDQARIFQLWESERELIRKQLTPTEIRKAIGQPGKDEAWAHQQLLDRGYSADDADTFLKE